VDAITAATISSRAFLFAVRNAYFEFKTNVDELVNDSITSETTSLQLNKNDSTSTDTEIEMKGQDQ